MEADPRRVQLNTGGSRPDGSYSTNIEVLKVAEEGTVSYSLRIIGKCAKSLNQEIGATAKKFLNPKIQVSELLLYGIQI